MLGLVTEEEYETHEDNSRYKFVAGEQAALEEFSQFNGYVEAFEKVNPVILELAATYDAFREKGDDHAKATAKLRKKKGAKCDNGREDEALKLLTEIGLDAG